MGGCLHGASLMEWITQGTTWMQMLASGANDVPKHSGQDLPLRQVKHAMHRGCRTDRQKMYALAASGGAMRDDVTTHETSLHDADGCCACVNLHQAYTWHP
jgi:hypothetical protein